MYTSWMRICLFFIFSLVLTCAISAKGNPRILMKTTMGDIELELFPDQAPESVKNFLGYVRSGFYTDVIFHRVIANFMIQGGGLDKEYNRKKTQDPVINEATNGLKNKRGTLAYARTNEINSATSQFFINLVDNDFLDHKDDTSRGFGYAVFGKVVQGMDVVDNIGKTKTQTTMGRENVPVKQIIILSIEEIKDK